MVSTSSGSREKGQRADHGSRVTSSHFWEYQLAVLLVGLVKRMRLASAMLMGRLLGYFAFEVLRIRRKVAIENLSNSFREKGHREIVELARRTYLNLGRMMVEFCRFPVLAQQAGIHTLVDAEGLEHLHEAHSAGRGALVVTAHFGNWELMAAKAATFASPFKVLVAHQKNDAVDALINRHRQMMNIVPLRVGPSVKEALRALRSNAFVGIAADQDAGRRGLFVDFLGRPASSHQGPAAIALREGCPLIMGVDVMRPRGKHTVFFERLLNPGRLAYTPENVRTITERYNRRLEDFVRQYPDQWFWVHRKWKTQPKAYAAVQ